MEGIELQLEYLKQGDAQELCELYQIVFKKNVTPEYFILKYGLLENNREQCATVARINSRIIGFYGAFLTEFCDFNKKNVLKVGQTCDYILLKKYRGKRVLDQLYKHSLAKMRTLQADYIYGFHSVQTYKFCQRFDWVDTHHFHRYHLPLGSKKRMQFINKLGGRNWLQRRLEKALNPYLKTLDFDKINREKQNHTQVYNDDFFKRKEFCSHYALDIEGCLLWLKYDYVITTGFVHFSDNCDVELAIQTLKNSLKKVGIFELVFHVQEGSSADQKLSQVMNAEPSFKISYLRLSKTEVSFDDLKLNLMDMDIF